MSEQGDSLLPGLIRQRIRRLQGTPEDNACHRGIKECRLWISNTIATRYKVEPRTSTRTRYGNLQNGSLLFHHRRDPPNFRPFSRSNRGIAIGGDFPGKRPQQRPSRSVNFHLNRNNIQFPALPNIATGRIALRTTEFLDSRQHAQLPARKAKNRHRALLNLKSRTRQDRPCGSNVIAEKECILRNSGQGTQSDLNRIHLLCVGFLRILLNRFNDAINQREFMHGGPRFLGCFYPDRELMISA